MDPSGKMLFTCASCGYRARIPERYSGKEVHCPRCQVVQVAQSGPGGNVSGQTLTFQSLKAAFVGEQTAMKSVEKPDDTVKFHCAACNYGASLAAKHAGTTIRCPGCGASQLVPIKAGAEAAVANTGSINRTPMPTANEDRILFTCGDCDYKARIPARYAGRSVLCPGCGKAVPASAATAAAVANLVTAPATGNTAVLTKVSTALADGQPQPQTGAMTRVGMQFTCAGCGYQSRISPSCAGGVISCPSCRAEQKVDMGPGGTAASAALERKPTEDVPEPTITPARGNRIGSGPLAAISLDDVEPTEPKAGSARLAAQADGARTPSGRFPSSVAPFTAELPPMPKAPAASAPKTDRRTAKTAPLPSVAATPRVAQLPVAKDAEDDDAALLAEARALAKATPVDAAAATAPAPSGRAVAAGNARPSPGRVAPAAKRAAPGSGADLAAAPAEPVASSQPAPRPARALPAAPAPRGRGLWAVAALLMMSVAACGVIGWQWQDTKNKLTVETRAHATTRSTLAAEQKSHDKTRAQLALTTQNLASTTTERDDERAARTKAETELASARHDLADVEEKLANATKRIADQDEQAKTLQTALDEQTAGRHRAEGERDDLQTRWDEAKRRLGDLLGDQAKATSPTGAATAAMPPVKRN